MEEFQNYRDAAVLIPILHSADPILNPKYLVKSTNQSQIALSEKTEILLTQRTDKVENHKNQISFPGGIQEEHDKDLEQTALREFEEEMGISSSLVKVIAELPAVPTFSSAFRVKPFVGLVPTGTAMQPNVDEIFKVLHVPLAHVLDSKNIMNETYEYKGVRYPYKTFQFEGHRIWGATARILQIFIERFLIVG